MISVNIKASNEKKLSISVDATTENVLALKQKIATELSNEVEPSAQRLIYSGRIMKDEDLLSIYKLEDGHT